MKIVSLRFSNFKKSEMIVYISRYTLRFACGVATTWFAMGVLRVYSTGAAGTSEA